MKGKALTTKEKILKASLKLFNKYGIDQVTVRRIAKELDISHGNLCYHYPTTNDIIIALYERFADEFGAQLSELVPNEHAFEVLASGVKYIFEKINKYKFFFLNFIEITRRIEFVRKQHYRFIELRTSRIRSFFDNFKAHGFLRKDIPPEQYELFIMHCMLYRDCWIQYSDLQYHGPEKDKVDYFVDGYIALFVPYLTDKGMKLLQRAREKGVLPSKPAGSPSTKN